MAKILIVDDSAAMRRNLKVIFRREGHAIVDEASNGLEACQKYEQHLPDLVTMDITMPIMGGIEAVKNIIKSHPDANIVMVSALNQKNMVFTALECGAKHYVIKPIQQNKVMEVVNEVLATYQAEKKDDFEKMLDKLESEIKDDRAKRSGKAEETFSIENKNGIFIVTIPESIDQNQIASLANAVKGLMYIKPLRIAVNFDNFVNVKSLTEFTLNGLKKVFEEIDSLSGELNIICKNKIFLNFLKMKFKTLASFYSEISEIEAY